MLHILNSFSQVCLLFILRFPRLMIVITHYYSLEDIYWMSHGIYPYHPHKSSIFSILRAFVLHSQKRKGILCVRLFVDLLDRDGLEIMETVHVFMIKTLIQ